MNKRKYAQLSLSLAAMLMAVPVWAAEQNNSAADVVANQTMTIGGKEQIVSQKALEQMREAQRGYLRPQLQKRRQIRQRQDCGNCPRQGRCA